MTSFNQSECLISALHSYALIKFVFAVALAVVFDSFACAFLKLKSENYLLTVAT